MIKHSPDHAERAREVLVLADKVEAGNGISNRLDCEIEIALFNPPADSPFASVHKNAATTKLVYKRHDGGAETYWARDWTMDRKGAADALRARAALHDAAHLQQNG